MNNDPSWHPIAACDDLAPRHVFHGQLLGCELAVWRADDGHVNVWENRCLHRGVRLTLGSNEGGELVCRYHGWRYANRTAGCTYIPAEPGGSPARTLCATTYPVVERFGLVWTSLDPAAPDQAEPAPFIGIAPSCALRALPINAAPETVLDAIAAHGMETQGTGMSVRRRGPLWIELGAVDPGAPTSVVCFVQPVDDERVVVRPVLMGADQVSPSAFRQHHDALARLRQGIEQDQPERPHRPAPELQRARRLTVTAAPPRTLQVTVVAKRPVAEGICSFELQAAAGQLPTAQPGAHIDIHLAPGITRQYSLVNGPGETDRYVIGVKLEQHSRGGSTFLHDQVGVGDTLTVSAPRHQFSLRRDSFRTVLIAGGIGITPLLAMAQALHAHGLRYELHYFAQSADHVAFRDRLARLGDAVTLHLGLDPVQTATAVAALADAPGDGEHLYVCGPGPMLDAVRAAAATAGWEDASVHFEYFANTKPLVTDTAFTVHLARSGADVEVRAGISVLDAVRAAGVELESSCQQGACGTCAARVLSGTPVHQDVHLNASERAANDTIVTCVSRGAAGARLVLDL